ncbi:glycosyltransferase family 9 protein [Sulfurisoma sediminicola]|uniref:ADP-heptose:LPS heptosyltransferase n=1 Tax=Sulfurisoma sediminicola TaxID=1381557 RepID=A0A497XKB6_9PROT|nr:glycosyltransferase family 9 protein [Sulfurisoma sediminicola]RLJ68314.1 ADP-heptose:LPS heptosyltransferase [Sulfurisoma sediminicola]
MIYALLTLLLAPLLRLFERRPAVPPRRVLVVQVAKIGDAICTTPLLRELRAGLPDARITVLAGAAAAPLLRVNPRIDEVLVADAADWKGLAAKFGLAARLRRGAFDAVLCCNGGATWPVVLAWAGIARRIGLIPNFGGRSQRLAERLWTSGIAHRGERMIVETYFEMLRALDLAPTDTRKEAHAAEGAAARAAALLPEAGRPLIGLAIGAANKLKELGTDKQAELVVDLLAAWPAARIVLLGGPGDRDQAAALLAAVPAGVRAALIDSCGALALADLPALLSRLDLFIGVDSGLTYIADALEVPLVSVAGPCNMKETGPVGPRARIVQHPLPCAPCAHIFRAPYACRIGTRECIRDVGSSEIMAAARDAMAGGAA